MSSINPSDLGLMKPQERLKELANFGNMVDIDPNIPIRRYYRSGMEMVRMAETYRSENQLENAYILYIKFMVLFLEKLPLHPGHKSVPLNLRQPNQAKLKEVFPITEKLKEQLRAKYSEEYKQFLSQKQKEEVAAAQAAQSIVVPVPKREGSTSVVTHPDIQSLDSVVYPNDFPKDPKSYGNNLILPNVPDKPRIDRSLKPSTSLIEAGLRTIIVPSSTMSRFLKLAEPNTKRNVETCGVLAGKLEASKFIITHVIVPKQSGTSDSCATTNEEDIFDYQDQLNLITLGWIHTHPSQTAFLSSVDLHTHCSYQIMLQEAIAIVCAPKHNRNEMFCLTPNHGLSFIAQCRQEGFHPHPSEPPLFMEAEHVIVDTAKQVEVVDLRA